MYAISLVEMKFIACFWQKHVRAMEELKSLYFAEIMTMRFLHLNSQHTTTTAKIEFYIFHR